MIEFLLTLGIDNVGHFASSDTYIIDLKDADKYSNVFDLLETSSLVESTDSYFRNEVFVCVYMGLGEYTNLKLVLHMSEEQQLYTLVCTEEN